MSGTDSMDLKQEDEEVMDYPKKKSRGENNILVECCIPNKREDLIKWDGWGYKDSYFCFKDGQIQFTGDRYAICNNDLPYLQQWIEDKFDVFFDASIEPENVPLPEEHEYPTSRVTEKQMKALKRLGLKMTKSGSYRWQRSHGQDLTAIHDLKSKVFKRIPDMVIWPTCHEDVVEIVKICDEHNIVIIPFGGGTSVASTVNCPENEERTILVLDTLDMNEILWINKENLLICCEGGILGQDLERELRKLGYTIGHEPDSIEFSTLGGWVSTRASGMKKNLYGNIEDIVVHLRMVTPKGVLEKNVNAPRMSCGPDFHHVMMGSEGCFGVVTEVTMKIRPLPECQRYGSLVFPDFTSGLACLREIAMNRCQPASLRLMDNEQFKFGRCMRKVPSYTSMIIEELKLLLLYAIKGFNPNLMTVATIVYEGSTEDVTIQERKVNTIAAKHGGLASGKTNGERGYNMTFVIAYIRDVAYDLNIMSASVETSVTWDKALSLIRAVKLRFSRECVKNLIERYLTMYRVAQVYDAGVCVYFYFSIKTSARRGPVEMMENLEDIVRQEIIDNGGTISHHHGIGKQRKRWYKEFVSNSGSELFKSCKNKLDPNNIFANGNILTDDNQIICKL